MSEGVGTYDGLYGSYWEKLGGLASMHNSSAVRYNVMRVCYVVLRYAILCHDVLRYDMLLTKIGRRKKKEKNDW